MRLSRLIYRSTATADVVSNATLGALESSAAIANQRADITGLLILSGTRFMQALEGDPVEVTALFGRIMADKRHHRVELMTFESIANRCFEDWNMRLVDLHDLPGDKRSYLRDKYPSRDGDILIPDDLCHAHALLLDARQLCLTTPWNRGGGNDGGEIAAKPGGAAQGGSAA